MRISTKLIIAILVPVLVALVVGGALIFTYLTLETAQENGDKVRLIRNSLTELNHLVFSYVTYRGERPKQQFLAEYEKMTGLIAGARFRNPGKKQLLDEIRLNGQSIKDTFLRLTPNTDLSGPAGKDKISNETEERLIGQLLIRSHKADSAASLLKGLVDEDIKKTQNRTLAFIFLGLVLTTFSLTIVLVRTGRSIISSLNKLRQGSEVIGAGNLDFVIEEMEKDETGELARAFNRMAANLKEVTASKADLEQEMAEREKMETELRASRKFLEIANRHIDLNPLLQDFVREIKKFTGCEAVGIRLRDENGNIPYMAYLGFSQKFYETESPLSLKTDRCMCINVVKGTCDPRQSFYTEGGSFYINGTTRFLATVSEEDKGPTRNVCNQTGYESVALIPIRLGTHIMGLIHLADHKENILPLDSVKILEKASTALGIGIRRTLAEESLKKSHADLEIKVAERTEELSAEIEQRERTEEALRESEEELRYLSSQILVAQEKERREIAEDLHDNTWQILNTIKIDVDQLLSPKTADDPMIARQTGKRIVSNIREAIERVRTMQGDLWPPVMGDIGLLATINWYGREFGTSHAGMTIEKQLDVTEEDVPERLKIVIYRVLQEALKNAAQHSGAGRVLLSLKKVGPGIEFVVTDNGKGFDLEQILFRARSWTGFGLIGMKERIEHSGGTFDIRSGEGIGTTIRASWPLNEADQEIPDRRPIRPVFEGQEEPFRMVTEAISDWVYAFRVEPNGEVLWGWVTSGFTTITGYSIDADLAEILHPEDKAVAEERFHFIQALRPHVSEYRIVTKSGETCWVRDSINPVADPLHPGTIKVVGAAQDITERKKAESEIQRQMEELKGINEELSRFNRAAVDRELRMIELKKQVNELCARAGRPPCYPLELEEEKGESLS